MASLIPRRAGARLLRPSPAHQTLILSHRHPSRDRHLHTSYQTIDPPQAITPSNTPWTSPTPAHPDLPIPTPRSRHIIPTGHSPRYNPARAPPAPQPTPSPTSPLTPHLRETLPLLTSQPSHYITLHIHGKPYLVTQGDTLRLPFLMHGVRPGDSLRLTRASLIGSRDFTLRGGAIPGSAGTPSTALTGAVIAPVDAAAPHPDRPTPPDPEVGRTAGLRRKGPPAYIDDRVFVVRATVLGIESEPLRVTIKKKQRNRHERKIKSKHRHTVLRISEVTVRSVEELEGDAEAEV